MPVIKIGFLNYFYHLTAKTISFPKNRMEFAGCKNFFFNILKNYHTHIHKYILCNLNKKERASCYGNSLLSL